jgi:Rod binding domain-containing protein
MTLTTSSAPSGPPILSPRDHALQRAAVKMEAQFLSEILKSSGFDARGAGLGGGVGEEQFQSFLRDAQAEAMAEAGGIGLAESLFQALKEKDNV